MLSFITGLAITAAVLGLAIYFAPKGWRTLAANGLAVLIPAAATFFEALANVDLEQYIDKPTAMGLGFGIILVNIFLRTITTTMMGSKD